MNIIYERTGVRYHEDCYKSEGSNLKYHKGDSLIHASKEEQEVFKVLAQDYAAGIEWIILDEVQHRRCICDSASNSLMA